MKLLFLGTGAANWTKGLDTPVKFFRRDSSALIDSELLIDPGCSVPEALESFNVDKSQIKYIINTHRHDDHFCPETVALLEKSGAVLVDFYEGETKTLGKYTITAFNGNHANTPTLHYLISDGEKELLYALDGSWLLPELFHKVIDNATDAVILDGTVGFGETRGIFEHNNMGMIVEMAAVLKRHVGKIYISHMSRLLHPDHETLKSLMEQHNVEVAFDGLEIDI